MAKLLIALLSLMAFNVSASELFAKADVAAGKALHDKNCVSCHSSSFGGDGSAMYTRDFAKVTDANKLIVQVRNCNTNIGLKWFEDEELNVAAHLNKTYYKFDQ
jgi:hypothetical protein